MSMKGLLILVAVLALPLGALAQPAPTSEPDKSPTTPVAPVTVEGAAPPKLIEKQAHDFVESYAAPTFVIDHIARWHAAVCVQVAGLVPAQAGRVQARVEEVAQGVGLKVMKPGCRSNIQIVFTDKPQAQIDAEAKHNDQILGFHYRDDTNAAKSVTRPIQAWYETATRGDRGGRANVEAMFAPCVDGAGQKPRECIHPSTPLETVDTPDNPPALGHPSSVFENVFVVADSRALQGRDLAPLIDYLAMLALSQPRSLDGCNVLPSVIDLLAKTACPGRDVPVGLTAADTAYLAALYGSDPEGQLFAEQADISGRMAKILVKAEAAGARSGGVTADRATGR
jgi:hypothetical protein